MEDINEASIDLNKSELTTPEELEEFLYQLIRFARKTGEKSPGTNNPTS